ncbi:MAG: sugar ABC transporter substrate-binding protein [Christensenellaceae bacterium]|nr:sugar ABC transporter substrate-binding protein [Christensenellaceae bacterium]
MKKVFCLIMVLLMVMALFTACGSKPAEQPAEETQAEEQPAEQVETEPEEVKEETKSTELALVPPAMESPFYAAVIEGAKPMAEQLGYTLTVLSPEQADDAAGQVRIVEDLVERGVAAIAICAHDDKAIVTAVKKANEAGIPIVIFNSLTDLPDGEVYAYTGYEQEDGGANIADWVNKVTNGNAVVGVLEGLPGFHTIARGGGFTERIKEYPGVTVAASQAADWSRETGMNVATNMFQANPEITVFYGMNDEMALGAAQAMKDIGREDILTVGIDGNPNAIEAVKAGQLTATLYVNPGKIGSSAVEMMVAALNGEPAPENKRVVVETVVVDATIVDEYLD